jgi:hypothetical protein
MRRATPNPRDRERRRRPPVGVPRCCPLPPIHRRPYVDLRGSPGWEACQGPPELWTHPHQNRQPPDLSDPLHLNFLEAPPELDKLRQPLMAVLGVEAPGLHLHQHRLMQI